jgi:hypothetical protein
MSANQNQTAQGYTPMRTAGFVLLACLAIVALSGWREWQSRTDALRNAEVDMMNLARSLTQHAEDTFEMADSILVGLVNRLEVDGTSPAAIGKLGAFLPIGKNNSRVRGIFIYGDAGQWLTTSERIDFKSFNNSDRDYFVSHRSSTDRGVLIGRPVKSRSGGQWIIPVSRRFNGPDGKFGGRGTGHHRRVIFRRILFSRQTASFLPAATTADPPDATCQTPNSFASWTTDRAQASTISSRLSMGLTG